MSSGLSIRRLLNLVLTVKIKCLILWVSFIRFFKTTLHLLRNTRNNEITTKIWNYSTVRISINKNITISHVFNSDDVRFVMSSGDQLWPLWLAISDLPPFKRCFYKNIVLIDLRRGAKKRNWEPLSNDLGQLLSCRQELEYMQLSLMVSFNIIPLLTDITATKSMLNKHHHPAKYGCTLCLIETDVYQSSQFYPPKKRIPCACVRSIRSTFRKSNWKICSNTWVSRVKRII